MNWIESIWQLCVEKIKDLNEEDWNSAHNLLKYIVNVAFTLHMRLTPPTISRLLINLQSKLSIRGSRIPDHTRFQDERNHRLCADGYLSRYHSHGHVDLAGHPRHNTCRRDHN
jgi:hypothetical protein